MQGTSFVQLRRWHRAHRRWHRAHLQQGVAHCRPLSHLRHLVPLCGRLEPAGLKHRASGLGPWQVLPGVLRHVGQHRGYGWQHALQPNIRSATVACPGSSAKGAAVQGRTEGEAVLPCRKRRWHAARPRCHSAVTDLHWRPSKQHRHHVPPWQHTWQAWPLSPISGGKACV